MKKTKTKATRTAKTKKGRNANARPQTTPHDETDAAAETGPDSPPASAADESAAAPAEESVETLKERVAMLEESVLRAKADYQNIQRRAALDKSEAIRFANADLMKSLVAVLDDFERSIQSAEAGDDPAAVLQGVRMVYDNLRKGLAAHGLECIDAAWQPFDPHLHEALMQQPSSDHKPGTVINEIAKGYKLRDRVIRPAKVVVSRAPD
ncbi:MAG: nucleotide exchange factor GrpE [Phycisphaerae bacterium]